MLPWKPAGLLLPCFYTGVGFTIGYCAKGLISAFFKPIGEEKPDSILQKEEDVKESDSESVSTVEEPSMNDFLLSTVFRPALLNILNKCDPVSFARMSMTCRGIRVVCLNSRGLRVPFPCKVVLAEGFDSNDQPYGPVARIKYLKKDEGYRVAFGRQLEHLKRLPFHFDMSVKFRVVLEMENNQVSLLDTFIRQFPKCSVKKLTLPPNVEICWPRLTKFIKDHGVSQLISDNDADDVEIKALLASKFEELDIFAPLPVGMVWKIMAKKAYIRGSDLNSEDFATLIQHIACEKLADVERWYLKKVHENLRSTDSFMKCFDNVTQVLASDKVLPTARPLVCFKNNSFCLVLTEKNRIFRFYYYNYREPYVSFSRVHVKESGFELPEIPEAFRPYVQQA